MKIKDPLYGELQLDEPVLIEIINSPTLQRLKEISQSGLPQEYNPLKTYSRYEHSIGVMFILIKLKASIENQIAGLLHDISHLAFSHIADWAISKEGAEREKLGLHESLTEQHLKESKIPKILEKYGYDSSKIIDPNNYPLVKRKMPELYVDYLDYSIRDTYYWFNDKIKEVLDHIDIFKDQIVFLDREKAQYYIENTIKLQLEGYGGVDNIIRYNILSEVFKYALKKEIIEIEDFYGVDSRILKKMRNSNNSYILNKLDILNKKDLCSMQGTFGKTIKKRFYCVIPRIVIEEKLIPLTEIYPELNQKIEKHRKKFEKGIRI